MKGKHSIKVHKLYKNKSAWTKKRFARDAQGKEVKINSKNARSWCLWGAVEKCYHGVNRYQILNLVYSKLPQKEKVKKSGQLLTIANWNDNPRRTFAQVKKLVTELDIWGNHS